MYKKAVGDSYPEIGAELGGLGILAVPSMLELAEKTKAINALSAEAPSVLNRWGHWFAHGAGNPAMEVAGLGLLAAPTLYHLGQRLAAPRHMPQMPEPQRWEPPKLSSLPPEMWAAFFDELSR